MAAAAAGTVEDACVLSPVARAAAKRFLAILVIRPRERTEIEQHHVAPRMRERKEIKAQCNKQVTTQNNIREPNSWLRGGFARVSFGAGKRQTFRTKKDAKKKAASCFVPRVQTGVLLQSVGYVFVFLAISCLLAACASLIVACGPL